MEEIGGPDLAFLDNFFVLDAELKDLVIITTSQEGASILQDLKTPRLAVVMRDIDELLAGSIDVDDLNSSIVVSNKHSAIEEIKTRSMMIHIKRNLPDVGVLAHSAVEHRDHIILSAGDKSALRAVHSSDLTSMCLKHKSEFLLLVPDVNSAICTSRVANAILVESSSGEFGLLKLSAEGTVLEETLASICWVPELEASRGDSNKL